MRFRRPLQKLSPIALLLLAVSALRADDLVAAYETVLRGDYKAGETKVEQLKKEGYAGEPLKALETWLHQYVSNDQRRAELRAKTLEWNVEQGRKALGDGKLYLALAFAAQGVAYSEDESTFGQQDWVKELRRKVLDHAAELEKQAKWTRALAFYMRLERVYPNDKELAEKREHAASHARLEVLYEKPDAVAKRTKDVDDDLVKQVLFAINERYYDTPDFRKMGHGAIKAMSALCETTKLYSIFDGIANKDTREHFLTGLEKLKKKIDEKRTFGWDDLRRLYQDVRKLNGETIGLSDALLVVEFLEGATGELDDFTSIVWPVDERDFVKAMVGNFCGVGIQLGRDEDLDRLKVTTPLENSPALEAGIQPDDVIMAVDGKSTKGWTSDDAIDHITGVAGTEVTLTLFRPRTKEWFDFTLTRSKIQVSSVRGVERLPDDTTEWNYILDKDTGVAYVKVIGFNPDTAKELDRALTKAEKQGMKGLVLDLRNNPGGLLDVAVAIVSMFQPEGEVVSTNGRSEPKEQHMVLGRSKYANLPLVILVNEGSASASEILAGALQDHNRAVVVGERTFGKGSVQKVLSLQGERTQLKLTTSLYFLPSGRSPHRKPDAEAWGVDPDVLSKITPKEFSKVIERDNRVNIIHNESSISSKAKKREAPPDESIETGGKKGDGDDDESTADLLSPEDIALLRSDPHEAPDGDPQLDLALLHLRVKLAGGLPWPRQALANAAGKAGEPKAPEKKN